MGVLPKLFKLSPWVDLDLFYAKVKFSHIGLCMGKSENYLFFGTYCSFRSQSCLKHLAKWVYEVEWGSKVKVILWSWSKVTQISKLDVWLLACILRWAIQGLRALLFDRVTLLLRLRLFALKQAFEQNIWRITEAEFVIFVVYIIWQSGILFWFQCTPPPLSHKKRKKSDLESLSKFTYWRARN